MARRGQVRDPKVVISEFLDGVLEPDRDSTTIAEDLIDALAGHDYAVVDASNAAAKRTKAFIERVGELAGLRDDGLVHEELQIAWKEYTQS